DSGSLVNEPARMQQVIDLLTENLATPDVLPPIDEQRPSRRLKHFQTVPRIEYDNTVSAGLTSLLIDAIDTPGILARIARCFADTRMLVRNAKIVTFGERIEDVFFITNEAGEQLVDEDEKQRLTDELLKILQAD
ncbi:MAG: hypothetical protein KTR32_08805, partial [Granulosicoccus sp.]|nr:hypothetical protein [Granulosicoccus sp.]